MANKFLRSTDGSDASNGNTWADAYATMAFAFSQMAAGDTLFVSDNHAETQTGAMTLTCPGTAANPCRILCVDDTGDPANPTTLATTATVTTTTAANMTISGYGYFFGITFSCGTGGSSATFACGAVGTPGMLVLESCKLKLGTSGGSSSLINFHSNSSGADDSVVELINTTFDGSAAQHGMRVGCKFIWRNTSNALPGSNGYTTLFPASTSFIPYAEIIGVDLSALGSGKNLVNVGVVQYGTWRFIDCKLGASVTPVTGTIPGQGSPDVTLINCDSADTNYRYHRQTYQGTITQETTIVKAGGASDGTTPVSVKMVSTANSKIFAPLQSEWIEVWNEATGSSKTLTVNVITDNVTLTDAEAWVEVEYLGTSGFPQGNFAHDRVADVLATAANQTTDSVSSWTTTGLGTPVKQNLAVSFTPQKKGLIRARVVLARASTTMYYDPLVTIA